MNSTTLKTMFQQRVMCIIFLSLCTFFFFGSEAFAAVSFQRGPLGYHQDPPATDSWVNGGISSWDAVRADWPSAHRVCYLFDTTAYASAMQTGKFHSPKDNTIIGWNGSLWYLTSAKAFNSTLDYVTCSSDAVPNQSLSVSPSSIHGGESATLTWDAGPYAELHQTQCTASNFSVGYTIPGYVTTQQFDFWGFSFEIPVWAPDQYVEQRSGSTNVAPSETTTYSYTCSNPNGSTTRQVTLTVVSNDVSTTPTNPSTPPDPQITPTNPPGSGSSPNTPTPSVTCGLNQHQSQSDTSCVCDAGYIFQGNSCVIETQCNDGIDNNGDGFTDGQDYGCATGAIEETLNGDGNPSIRLTVAPPVVQSGRTCIVTWTTKDLVSCLLSGSGTHDVRLNGTVKSPNLTNSTSYTLNCLTHSGITYSKTASCKVFNIEEF